MECPHCEKSLNVFNIVELKPDQLKRIEIGACPYCSRSLNGGYPLGKGTTIGKIIFILLFLIGAFIFITNMNLELQEITYPVFSMDFFGIFFMIFSVFGYFVSCEHKTYEFRIVKPIVLLPWEHQPSPNYWVDELINSLVALFSFFLFSIGVLSPIIYLVVKFVINLFLYIL